MSTPVTQQSRNGSGTCQLDAGATSDVVLGVHGLQTLNNVGRSRRYLAKEIIYRESDRVEWIYVIRSGLVKLLSYLPNGRARIVRLHDGNDWIGLEGLLGQPYGHTAVAVGDVEVRYLGIHSLQRLNRDNPGVLDPLLRQWQGALVHADR